MNLTSVQKELIGRATMADWCRILGEHMERFTDRCRQVFAMANQEAIRRNHEFIDSEHILLGLVKEGTVRGGDGTQELRW
jgi:hypothetical protein